MARTARLNLRLRPDENKKLRRVARQARVSPTGWARRAVLNALQHIEELARNPIGSNSATAA